MAFVAGPLWGAPRRGALLVALALLTGCAHRGDVAAKLASPPAISHGAATIDLVVTWRDPPPGTQLDDGCRKVPVVLVLRRVVRGSYDLAFGSHWRDADARFCPASGHVFEWRPSQTEEPVHLSVADGTYDLAVYDPDGTALAAGVRFAIENAKLPPPTRSVEPFRFEWRHQSCVDVGCIFPACLCTSGVGHPSDPYPAAIGSASVAALLALRRRRRARVV